MELLDLFIVAMMPILKTLMIIAVGLFLALDRVDILPPSARHHLNNVVFYVFTPALVGSSLADTITMGNVVSLWFMPVNILLTFIIGSALGWILVRITKTPQQLHGLVIGCCAAGNLGALPLIIVPAVCQEKNSPFGESTHCSSNGEAYVSLSMAIGSVYIWIYVYNLIRSYSNEYSYTLSIESSDLKKNSTTFSNSCTEALLLKESTTYEDNEAPPLVVLSLPEDEMKVPAVKKIRMHVKSLIGNLNLKMLFTPSTIATFVGLFIGVVSPIRHLMIGNNAPLRVLTSSVIMLGQGCIPSMTLIVGANLLKGLRKSGAGLWLVIGILVVRYIALPLSGILVVKVASHFGLVGSDSLYQFVLMLQYALPPAMSIGTITQLFHINESECSVIMLWTYAVASVALTLWSTYFLWFLS